MFLQVFFSNTFIEIELSEEGKNRKKKNKESFNIARKRYRNISKEEKRNMCQYASQQFIVNMFANNTEIFLKKTN